MTTCHLLQELFDETAEPVVAGHDDWQPADTHPPGIDDLVGGFSDPLRMVPARRPA